MTQTVHNRGIVASGVIRYGCACDDAPVHCPAGADRLPMKRTDLEKNKALKVRIQLQQAAIPGRFAAESKALPDRREQRKLDQAAGLVPFAAKLPAELVRRLRELAEQEGGNLNESTARVIEAGLASSKPAVKVAKATAAPAAPAPKAPVAKKAAAKKATAATKVAKKAANTTAKAKA